MTIKKKHIFYILISQLTLFSILSLCYSITPINTINFFNKKSQFISSRVSWSNATVISDDITGWNVDLSNSPSIATDNDGNVHVVWSDDTNGVWGTDYEILYVNYTITGWSNVTAISDIYGWNDDSSFYPDIATDKNGDLHVVWEDWTDGEWGSDIEIMYANYTAAGWSNTTVISDIYGWNDGASHYPSIAVDDSGNLHVVWQDFTIGEWGTDAEIFYMNYTAAGWSNATAISDIYGWNDDISEIPRIAVDNSGNLHIVWQDATDGEWGTDAEIMYANYTTSGWSNASVISDLYGWNDDSSYSPDIDIDKNGNLHIVWYDETDGEWGTDVEIFYVNFTTTGWSNATIISDIYGWNDGISQSPRIVSDINGNIHVAWVDITNGEWGTDGEIFYANYTISGWSNATVISDDLTRWNVDNSLFPSIDTDIYGNIYVVWSDDTNGEWGNDREVMYSLLGDLEDPNITSVSRDPAAPGNLDSVNITVHITDNGGVDTVLINSNHTGSQANYTMDLLSGTVKDGYWNFTIPAYPTGTTIIYSFWVNDTYFNTDTDGPYQYKISDNENPNIILVSRDPIAPGNLNTVNITVHITDNTGVDIVLINSNHTGSSTNHTMDFLSGTTQNGYWNYTIPAYPAGTTITYSILANDTFKNSEIDGPYQYTISDNENPVIVLVSRDPLAPGNLDSVNITVHITDNTGADVVLINSNHTGSSTNYTMEFLSGTAQDGYWNYSIPAYPAGTTIDYSIWVNDTNGNTDTDGSYQYTINDNEDPKIILVLRDPVTPSDLDEVNITVHITDNTGVDVVLINSNHTGSPTNYTMDLLSGTALDGYWNYTISAYPQSTIVNYTIIANDTENNFAINGSFQYKVPDSDLPNITSVSRDPNWPTSLDSVNITVHVTDNIGVDTVLLISNHSGVFLNYTMTLLSGNYQDGYWNFTIPQKFLGITVNYTIWVNDTSNNCVVWNYEHYTVTKKADNDNLSQLLALMPREQFNMTFIFIGIAAVGAIVAFGLYEFFKSPEEEVKE